MSTLFYRHGMICAVHPKRVLFVFCSLFYFFITFIKSRNQNRVKSFHYEMEARIEEQFNIVLYITQVLAIFYVFYQLKEVQRMGSKYLLRILLFIVLFSTILFCATLLYAFDIQIMDMFANLPFFFLALDISLLRLLAQFVLSSQNRIECQEKITEGMAILCPSLTIDTALKVLLLSVGVISGVRHIEEISEFYCLSLLINYLVFMTVFPVSLSFIKITKSTDKGMTELKLISETEHKMDTKKRSKPWLKKFKFTMLILLTFINILSRIPRDYNFELHNSPREFPTLIEWMFYDLKILINCMVVFVVSLIVGLIVSSLIKDFNDIQFDKTLPQKEVIPRTNGLVKPSIDEKPIKNNTNSDAEQIGNLLTIDSTHDISLGEQNKKKISVEEKDEIIEDTNDIQEFSFHKSLLQNVVISAQNSVQDRSRGGSTMRRNTIFYIGDSESSEEDLESNDSEFEEESTSQSDRTKYEETQQMRDISTLTSIMKTEEGINTLTDEEIKLLVLNKHIPLHRLEYVLGNEERSVAIRRSLVEQTVQKSGVLNNVPFMNFEYKTVLGACCENVIGYIPVPLGMAGPILLNDKDYYIPMATTEGCLVASVNRGCRALSLSGGVRSCVYSDGMTRAPVIHFPTAMRAVAALKWLQNEDNYMTMKKTFESTSRFACLQRIQSRVVGRYLYLRFISSTGDAMGMNMISKATEAALNELSNVFLDIERICLSGNLCTDKKSAAINWIEGRGKSVVCEAIIPSKVIETVLKTTAQTLERVNISKNLIGSSVAVTIGGNNAHSANVVAAIFIACGQDAAQVVGSSNCMTLMEVIGDDLHVSCSMPSLEVGTIGGGTVLKAQNACLELLGVNGSSTEGMAKNSSELSSIICGAVMAGELSVMSALATGHLVGSHMTLNRSRVFRQSINESN